MLFLAAVLKIVMPDYFDIHSIRVASIFHDLGVQQWRLEQRMLGIEVKVPKSESQEPENQVPEVAEEG